MKKTFNCLLFLLAASLAGAQTLVGSWQGVLPAGSAKLRLVFHVQKNAHGVYESTMDSPDQSAFGIACSETRVQNDSLSIEIQAIHGGYRGKWDGRDELSGYYFQNGMQFPLKLTRSADSPVVQNRPQTPKPPFPYKNDSLEYDNPATGVHYSGTLSYPGSGGPFPAVILITGSGQEDRDETIYGHKPFAVIADYLTRRGFAVLRVDDRGIGKSTGDLARATSADFAGDVETGVQELRRRKDIDGKKIGLIGHSEGGLIAAMAGVRDPTINFIIMLAGPGLKGSDLLARQTEAISRSRGFSEEMAKANRQLSAFLFQSAIQFSGDSAREDQQNWLSFLSWKKNTKPETLASLGLSDSSTAREFLRSQAKMLNIPWLLFFLKTDPADYIRQLQCRVLALNGAKDIQVLPDENLAAIDGALKQSRSPLFASEKIPGLNHLFQHCQTCRPEEYSQLEESFAPEVLKKMGDWLDKNVK